MYHRPVITVLLLRYRSFSKTVKTQVLKYIYQNKNVGAHI